MSYQEHIFYVTPLGTIAHYTILECVIGLCFTVITVLLQLPYEYIGENPVPTIIFKGRPNTFHAFLICVLLAFTGSTKAIVSPYSCKIGRFCGFFSIASIASAFLILLWALLCQLSCTP